jgi:hypothetical protein
LTLKKTPIQANPALLKSASPTIDLNSAHLVRLLCLSLFLNAKVTFRSIPRIFEQFNLGTPLTISWVPHFTSVINWVNRLGLGLLNQVKTIDDKWLAIIDHSIGIGTKKTLVVLRVRLDTLFKRGGAIRLEDCECIGLAVAEKVNGETTADDLNKIFESAGKPIAIIKDCDATLNKAYRLVAEKQEEPMYAIDDIGHVIASGLKADYDKRKSFKDFISIAAKGAKYIYQTTLACFVPPKLRTKGRFQSISHLGKWAKKILSLLNIEDIAETGSDLDGLREAFHGLKDAEPCIDSFINDCDLTTQIMHILKNKGLDFKTYEQCYDLSDKFPESSHIQERVQGWLDKHIAIQQEMTKLPALVSSDIIESLFGQFKYIISRGSCAEMNRSVLFIPAMCGNLDNEVITRLLDKTEQKDVIQWDRDNIGQTLNQKRRVFSNSEDIQELVKTVPT